MKNETIQERAIRDSFKDEKVPEQIHRAIVEACNSLPEKEKAVSAAPMVDWAAAGKAAKEKKSRRTWRAVASSFGAVAAAFLLLCGTNAVNPAFAESIPLIGNAFREYNHSKKVSMGTYIGTYGGVSQISAPATGENSAGLKLTADEAYSDGEYIHISFTMEDPEKYLEKYYYLAAPVTADVNGEALDSTDSFLLWTTQNGFTGTAALKLNSPVEDGAALALKYNTGTLTGYYNEGGDWDELEVNFSGEFSIEADTENNRIIEDFKADGDITVQSVESSPSYTKITYEIPFWGIGGWVTDYPMLYTMNGEIISVSSSEEVDIADPAVPRDAKTVTSTHLFDGLPMGTEQVILRFYESFPYDSMKAYAKGGSKKIGVLGEVTINLATGEATPSKTYLKEGLSYAYGYLRDFNSLEWSVAFDDLLLRSEANSMNREDVFANEELFQKGFALGELNYDKTGKNRLTANFYSTNEFEKSLDVIVIGEDGRTIANGTTQRENVFENDMMIKFDTREEMLANLEEELEDIRNSEYSPPKTEEEKAAMADKARAEALRTYPGQYSYKVVMTPLQGMEPELLETVTVKITDSENGETIYEKSIRFVRKS